MNQITGYLPVWITYDQTNELKTELSKHYTAEYFSVEELKIQDPTFLKRYRPISALNSDTTVLAYFRDSRKVWEWFRPVPECKACSLMKLS